MDFTYVLATCCFLSISMFVYIPGQHEGFYMAYAAVTYIIWGTLYSTVNIPYGSMASVITSNPVERSTLSTWRTVGSNDGSINFKCISTMLLFINNKPDGGRFFLGALGFGVIADD